MKIQHLIIFIIMGIFVSQVQAMSPRQGGATGGAEANPDISKCDLNPSKQTKIKFKGKDGGDHFVCTGQAVCAGKTVPVSCKITERELCPISKKCIEFNKTDLPDFVPIINNAKCADFPILSQVDFKKAWELHSRKKIIPSIYEFSKKELKRTPFKAIGEMKILTSPSPKLKFHSNSPGDGLAWMVSEKKDSYAPAGKIEAIFNKDKFECSGGLISLPDSNSLGVITAAHCIFKHDRGNRWADELKFTPNFGYGNNDLEFSVKRAFISSLWYDRGSTEHLYDYAILILNTQGINTTSLPKFGLLVFPDYNKVLKGTAMGYAAHVSTPQMDKLWASEIKEFLAFPPSDEVSGIIKIKNNMIGASGGPWIGHSSPNDFGYIFSVNSLKLTEEQGYPNFFYGPYFSSEFKVIWDASTNPSTKCESNR